MVRSKENPKRAERVALARTAAWPVLVLPAAVLFDLHTSVFVIFLLSLYANAATDWGDYHAAKSARLNSENGSEEPQDT